jgi:hypothetical protein
MVFNLDVDMLLDKLKAMFEEYGMHNSIQLSSFLVMSF